MSPDGPPPRAALGAVGRQVRDLLTGPAGRAELDRLATQRSAGAEPDPRGLYRLLGRHGLLAPSWPERHGGRGAAPSAAAELVTELVAAGVPETLHTLSVQICGNFLRTAGTAAQRAAVLPALAAGARYCTVLYSEPDVGSDLAALTTRARRGPDGTWRLTGRKVYSVRTGLADIGLVAARTGTGSSRYQGITLFLVDLAAAGVGIAELDSIAEENFADVTLDEVPVPADWMVGPLGGAWPLITGALALERVGIDHVAKARRWLAAGVAAGTPGVDPARVGELAVRTAAGAELARHCVAGAAAGTLDPVRAAATKLWCSETARDVAWWAAEQALPDPTGMFAAAYREAPGLTISAGTSEMMLELVAASGLAGPDRAPSDDDPLGGRLRAAARAVFAGAEEPDDPAARPDWWTPLAQFGAFRLDVPVELGGLALGPAAVLAVCDEAGRALLDGGLLATLTVVHALGTEPGGPAAALLPDALTGRWWATDAPGPAGGADAPPLLRFGADTPPVLLRGDGTELALSRPGPVGADGTGPGGPASMDAVGVLRSAAAYRRAAWLGGLAAGALAHTVRRVAARQQFGRAIGDNQSVAFTLARLAVRYQALRALLDAVGAEPERCLAAGVLASAGRLALDATRTAVQLHGAYGMTSASPVARGYVRAAAGLTADASPDRLYAVAAALAEPR